MTIQNLIIPTKETHISILIKRQRFIGNSLKGILLVNFPEKEKNFLIKNLAAENKIALITQSASLLLKDSRNNDDSVGVDDPIQILFDKVKNCIPCICFINNLDRIGKQRYEQEQKSLHWLNHSISLLIDNGFTNDRIPKKKKNFILPTRVLFNKAFVSRFDHDLLATSYKKMAILKNLKIFQISLFKKDTMKAIDSFNLENLTTKKKWLISPPLNRAKNLNGFSSIIFDKKFNLYYNYRLPFWLFTNSFFPKQKIDPDFISSVNKIKLFNSKKKKGLLKFIESRINFLPLQMAFSKNLASPFYKNKTKTSRRHYYDIVNFVKEPSTKDTNKTNYAFEKSDYRTINSKRSKTFFENPGIIDNKFFFKKSFIKSNSNKMFQNKLKNFSRGAIPYYSTPLVSFSKFAKRKPSFKDLGNTLIDKTKISLINLTWTQQTIKNSIQNPSNLAIQTKLEGPLGSLGNKKPKTPQLLVSPEKKPNKSDRFHMSIPKTYGYFINHRLIERDPIFQHRKSDYRIFDNYQKSRGRVLNMQNTGAETEIIKRTALLKFLQILDGFHTTTGKKKHLFFSRGATSNLNIFGIRTKTKNASMFKVLFQHKYSKFVMRSLFNKHSWFKFFNYQRGDLNNAPKKDSFYKLALRLQKKNPQTRPLVLLPSRKRLKAEPWGHLKPLESQPKLFKLNFDQKNSLFIKNLFPFRAISLVLAKKPKKSDNLIILPSIQNQITFSKITRFKKGISLFIDINNDSRIGSLKRADSGFARKLGKTFKFNIDHAKIIDKTTPRKTTSFLQSPSQKALAPFYIPPPAWEFLKNNFLEYVSQRKIHSPLCFHNRKVKWEIYLKNQPWLTSLNLLCVWPSSMEEIIGSFNINDNDGASYLLPPYFQLLGHGLKLKKQGITLIASTNNLTTLDKALLRPGRFDTIINFSHSSLSMNKFYTMLKHSPSLIQDNQFFSRFNPKKENLSVFEKSLLPYSKESSFRWTQGRLNNIKRLRFSKNSLINEISWREMVKSLIKPLPSRSTKKISNFLVGSLKFNQKSINPYPSREKNNLVERSYIQQPFFRFNNAEIFLAWSVTLMNRNISKVIKNFFYMQVTVLDVPNQSIPIKTFIDVSVFIQYKLWWSFNNEKLLWFRLYEKSLIQQNETSLLKSLAIWGNNERQTLKLFKSPAENRNIDNVILIIKSKIYQIKNLCSKAISYMFLGILQIICFFFNTIFQFFRMLQSKYTKSQTYMFKEQNSNSINDLGRQVLMSKAVNDFRLSLPFDNLKNNINQNHDIDWLTMKNQSSTKSLPNNLYLLNAFLDQYYVSKNEIFRLPNFKNQTMKNFNIKHEHMFFKSNRSLLFWIGDFDYKTYSEKDSDLILVFGSHTKKTPWFKGLKNKGSHVLNTNQKKKSINQGQDTNSMTNKKVLKNYFNGDTLKNTFLKCQFHYFSKSRNRPTAFLDKSAKTWKNSKNTMVIKNVNTSTNMLIKYNKIYRLKKKKLKQSFLNLHPLTRLMLKRWLEVTKPNKLKQHLKVPLMNICLSNNNFYYQKTSSLNENQNPINTSVKKQSNFPLYQKNQQNFSVIQNSWFSNFDLRSLYSASLLVPTNSSLSKEKESLDTLSLNSFLAQRWSYESYLFKKLSTNFSLNIKCLQIDPDLSNLIWLPFNTRLQVEKKNIDISGLLREYVGGIKNWSMFSHKQQQIKTSQFPGRHLWQSQNRVNKIPRKTVTSNTREIFQTSYKFQCFNPQIDELKIKNNIILLENFVPPNNPLWNEIVRHKKNEVASWKHNFIEEHESVFQKYKMCRLDLSFFVLIFYTIFFEKIIQKKITLNTIKLFRPYKSLLFSHFLLSQGETCHFSCKNLEILIYSKFKNFLVDL